MIGEIMSEYKWHWIIEWSTPSSAHMHAVKKIIYTGRSRFQEITILEYEELGKALILDGKTQSALHDEFVYHEALVHPAMILHGSPKRVLILGGGEGATAREVFRFKSVEEVVMVDIDEEVINVSKKYLPEMHRGAFNDPRLKLVIGDGFEYVMNSKSKFDVIIADLADPLEAGPAYKLYTLEFYQKISEILDDEGVFVTQATSPTQTTGTHAVIYNTIKKVFRYAAPYHVYIKSFDGVWGFIIASNRKDPKELKESVIESRIAEMVSGENRFYDPDSHKHMFTILKNIKDEMRKYTQIATLEKPVFMPA